jgi:guanosine-3',5'-bis(diphosphate) 3'-pyrophosphohydrolase
MAVQFAPCCQPIPGDPIIGSIWKGKGLVIHTHDCPAIRKARSAKPTKWIDVEWEPEAGQAVQRAPAGHGAEYAWRAGQDRHRDIEFGNQHRARQHGREASRALHDLHFTVQVASRTSLARLMRSLRRIASYSGGGPHFRGTRG